MLCDEAERTSGTPSRGAMREIAKPLIQQWSARIALHRRWCREELFEHSVRPPADELTDGPTIRANNLCNARIWRKYYFRGPQHVTQHKCHRNITGQMLRITF